MANPWDQDEIVVDEVVAAPVSAMPWDQDEIIQADGIRTGDDGVLELDIVGGVPESQADFSDVTSSASSTADGRMPDGWQAGVGRDIALSGRSVIQGLGGLVGAIGGDAFNHYIMPGDQPSYRDAAGQLADRFGLPKPQNASERVAGDIGEALTGTAAGFGAAGLARGAASPIARGVAEQTIVNPGMQVASTVGGSGAAGVTRESGGGAGAQLAAGIIGGAGPSVVGTVAPVATHAALSRPLSYMTNDARRELGRQALDRGIELTPAQLSDSRFIKYVQSALRSVPFTGAERRSDRQVSQFNRAVANAIGEQAESVDSQVYARAKARQSALFDELTSRNAIQVDNRLLNSLQNISESSRVSPQAAAAVDAAVDRLYSQATTGPGGVVIPGRAYQALDSDLGNITRGGGPESHYVGQIQTAIRGAMDRSISPQDSQAWRQLRREYGNRKTIAPLVAAAGDEGISPARLRAAATNTKSSKEAMASGTRGELGTLGNIGSMMREPPSSGTAERAAVGSLFAAGGYANPVIAAASYTAAQLAARGLDSRTIARLMIQENPGLSMADAERIAAQALIPTTSNISTVE